MAQRGNGNGTENMLRRLAGLLEDATTLAEDLVRDRTLRRLLETFRLMPLEDRDPIVDAMEREVTARRLSLATEGATGQSMHPNRNARLYLRSHQKVVPRNLLERDELMLAMLQCMHAAPLLRLPDIHGSWIDGSREALTHVDAATRAAVAGLVREFLALLDDVTSTDEVGRRAS
jgi:hypothetical protein